MPSRNRPSRPPADSGASVRFRVAAILAALVSWHGATPGAEGDTRTLERVLEHSNRGIALMERFQPVQAVSEFREVVRLLPNWIPGRLNLAIALLNTQRKPDLRECRDLLLSIQKDEPGSPHVHYTLGMLHLHQGENASARRAFEVARALAPRDAHTLYQLGSIARREGRLDEAEALFKKAIEYHPGLSSAHYGLGRLALSRGNRSAGLHHLRRFQELENQRVGIKVGMKYSEMGPHADVLRLVHLPGWLAPPASGTATLQIQRSRSGLGPEVSTLPRLPEGGLDPHHPSRLGPETIAGDFNGDGRADLFVAGNAAGQDRLLLGEPGGGYRERSGALASTSGEVSTCAAAGDYDGDGDLDLFVARTGGCSLYQNGGDGTYQEVATAAGLDTGEIIFSAAVFADADHDGDLDLFLAGRGGEEAGAPDRLYVNLGTGGFAERGADLGIATPGRSRAAVFGDLDGDGSLDLYVAVDGGPNRLYRNGRVLDFEERGEAAGVADAGPATGVLAADFNGDGYPELVLLRGPDEAPILYRNFGGGRFERKLLLESGAPGAVAGCAADLDLDGALDLALATAPGDGTARVLVLRGDGRGGLRRLPGADLEITGVGPFLRSMLPLDVDVDGSVDLLLTARGLAPVVLETVPPPGNHWLRISLRGVRRRGASFSNTRGIGAKVEVKAGDRWTLVQAGLGGQPQTPVHVGLGSRNRADYIRILWPDGILQSEMEIAADREITIEEVVRKPSSCPLLFTWDGTRFRFVTDFLGTGGLGFLLRPGVYAPPDPTEDVRIPPGLLVAAGDGKLRLRILEPLEEVCYLDRLALLAVDHPADTEAYPEERFGGSAPPPSGRLVVIRERRFLREVRDEGGRDVTELLRRVDRRWPGIPRDARFVGFARDHSLTFDLGAPVAGLAGDGNWFLFLDGWVEYTYSHTNFAAHQAGRTLRPPVLEIPDGAGNWTAAIASTGYPAGLPRTMVLPLGASVLEAGRFRLRTNMEIYWDRVFLARDVSNRGGTGVTVHELPPLLAELRYFGYPREYSPDGQDPPLYDYGRKDPGVFFRNIPGDYTRSGDVRELLLEADDRFVIFGRGDEVALTFDGARLPPVAAGTTRTFILRSLGYCKDRDLHTGHSRGVEPLPFSGMSGYPYPPDEHYPDGPTHRRYREVWNTRRVRGEASR